MKFRDLGEAEKSAFRLMVFNYLDTYGVNPNVFADLYQRRGWTHKRFSVDLYHAAIEHAGEAGRRWDNRFHQDDPTDIIRWCLRGMGVRRWTVEPSEKKTQEDDK